MSTPDPTESAVRLARYVGAVDHEDGFVDACDEEATALVTRFIGTTDVPKEVRARAILEVGADLYYRKHARNGIVGIDDDIDAPVGVRIARDPMQAAYPLLRPYQLGFA